MRTMLVIVTPALGLSAAFYALRADGLAPHMPDLPRAITALADGITAEAFAGAFLIVTLVYAVETGQFVSAWTDYKTAVKTLATGTAADPSLGDPHFVSSGRIDADLNRLSWFSTTQYLSVIVATLRQTSWSSTRQILISGCRAKPPPQTARPTAWCRRQVVSSCERIRVCIADDRPIARIEQRSDTLSRPASRYQP